MITGPLWNVPVDALLADLQAGPDGLSQGEARRRLAEYGPNDAMARRGRPLLLQIADRLANPLILILLFASGLSAWTGEVASCVIIVAIIFLSVILDVVQQRRAEGTIDMLRRSVGLKARVVRDGRKDEIPVEHLVPGDIVELSAGDIVPGDCRVLSARDLYINEALLTGEPYPAEKRAGELKQPCASPAEAANTLFMGTSVVSGMGTALVCRTGGTTELGGLASGIAAPRPADAFEQGIRRFGFLMLRFTVFLVLFVVAANTLFQRPWLESLLFALALAVGLTPELLPMVVTVTLARGAERLARRRVIVKRLAAIHDLGAIEVLCTDKTGTLTESRMKLVTCLDADGRESETAFRLAYLNSSFETGMKNPLDEAVLATRKLDVAEWRKIDEVPFDFQRRRISVLLDDGARRLLVVKGAPEDIIGLSDEQELADGTRGRLDDAGRRTLIERFERLGEDGYRALAVASRDLDAAQHTCTLGDESGLTFVGFLAFVDPPKADAGAAVRALAEAGVSIKILTGDNERITRHICREIGLSVSGLVTGQELSQMGDDALHARLAHTNVFCRVTPPQKERILRALKRSGKAVGFLGDGINDAPALHAADVGITVDNAADVAKEAADIVLLERDLDVLKQGVLEGRRTVANAIKYIKMGSSSNFGNMFSMAGAALFLPFLPMLPAQVLLNNLLYDISEVGVPFDNVDEEALRKPLQWDTGLIEKFMVVLGPVSSLFDFLTFYALIALFGASAAMFQTGWFIESLATQALVIFVIRTRRRPWRSTPHPVLALLSLCAVAAGVIIPLTPLGEPFGFVPPPAGFYVFLCVAVVAYLALVEVVKHTFFRVYARRKGRVKPWAW